MKLATPLDDRLEPSSFEALPTDAFSARTVGAYWLRALAGDLPSPWRALFALAVVFLLLATTGWTANRHSATSDDPKHAALTAWLRGSVSGHRLPSPDAPPSAIAHFFTTINAAQRARLAERYPLVVGNLDGVPVHLRYHANRISLHNALVAERLRRRTADLTAVGEDQALRRVHRLESLLAAGRQILSFDPTGRGQAAEVIGDLSTAQRVSVVVPGSNVDLLSFERTDKARSAPVGMARSLYTAARTADPRTPIAVVAWADYRTPVGLGMDAATGTLAENGAERLRRMVSALPHRAVTALFCHSYGSVVCGVAAPELPDGRVSDIAVFGSPGMRVDHARDLHTEAHVWAARDGSDWIADVPHLEFAGLGHGEDPVSHRFGARVISAERARGHTGYFESGTASLRNFARLAQGQYATVTCAAGRGCRMGLA